MSRNTFNTYFNFVLVSVVSIFLYACNNKNNSSPPPPVCPVGYVATPAGCVPGGANIQPLQYVPFNGYIQYYASKTDFITQKDTLIPTENYRTFLRDALGVCDRCSSTSGVGMGEALECGSWVKGFNMLMISLAANQGSTHQMSFYSTPKISQSYFNFAWQFPDIGDFFVTLFTGAPAPSCNYGQFSPYWATQVQYDVHNNGQGFVLFVNNGPNPSKWNLFKFRLYVPVGKIGDPSFNFKLSILDKDNKSYDLATGTLTKCTYSNCGM